jgi:outer membrane protein
LTPIWICLIFAAHLSFAGPAVSLKDAYQAALDKTESAAILDARATQASERVSQAKGAIFPELSLKSNYIRQQSLPNTRSESSEIKFNLIQPVFRGFREFSYLRSIELDLNAQTLERTQLNLSTYTAVGQVYFAILTAEQDLKNLTTLLELMNKRVQEVKSRTQIGRSRTSELLTAQSQAATLQTQIRAAQLVVDLARDRFSLVTGLPRDTAIEDSVLDLPTQIPALTSYLDESHRRPDLSALKTRIESSEEKVAFFKGAHWPTLDFSGNYYLKHTRPLDRVKWDLGLTLTLPLYQGGVVSSQVREAAAKVQEQELSSALAIKSAEQEIRSYYQQVTNGIEQMTSIKEGLEIAEKNYQEQNRDYRFGLSTNLDVLQALNVLQDTRRALDRTKYQTLTAWHMLQAAAGKSP